MTGKSKTVYVHFFTETWKLHSRVYVCESLNVIVFIVGVNFVFVLCCFI